MATQDGQSNPPDSWDQELNGGSGDSGGADQLSKPLSSLNVNAPSFVPGQNVFAAEFVPSTSSEENTSEEAQETPSTMSTEDGESKCPEQAKASNTTNSVEEEDRSSPDGDEDGEIDNWEENEEGSGEGDTPDSEDTPSDISAVPKKKKNGDKPADKSIKKEHVNVVFIGHVDAGKSTIGGHIMYLKGQVDKRTLEKYEREAKEKNRETWYLSWALDTNQEERDKGKTVEVGRAFFETDERHFTILDAPGHKSFVPNMIGGASQADLAVLVISARKGEFETGFERGGQTREHAMLAKTAGVKHLVVLINKMDDPTVEWSLERYNECKDKLIPYLKKVGFNPKLDVYFMPVSGMTGAFLRDIPPEDICPWYRGPALIEYLNTLPTIGRMAEGPVRIPLVDRYKDMGTIVLGKVESGIISKGQFLQLMPNKVTVEVMMLWSDDEETDIANPGENVKVKLKGVEEEDVSPGFVLCTPDDLCCTGHIFDAQIVILEHKSIICAGYSGILHIHTCAEEVTIKALLCLLDKKTGEKTVMKPRFIKQDQVAIARLEVNGGMICLEAFKEFPQMGRFTLRDEGRTIAIGKVLKIRE